MSPRAVTLGPWAQIWAWAQNFKIFFGGARGASPCHLAHFMKFGPRPNFQLFRKRFCLITHLPPDQWVGQPLTKNLRATHENLAKPLETSSHVAKKDWAAVSTDLVAV